MAVVPQVISTNKAPRSTAPISQAIRLGSLIFVSGQLGTDPATQMKIPGGIEAETEQAIKNIAAVLEEAGSSLANVVKTTCFLTDKKDIPSFNQAYARMFPHHLPARSTVEVGLSGGYLVEVEAIAYIPTGE